MLLVSYILLNSHHSVANEGVSQFPVPSHSHTHSSGVLMLVERGTFRQMLLPNYSITRDHVICGHSSRVVVSASVLRVTNSILE